MKACTVPPSDDFIRAPKLTFLMDTLPLGKALDRLWKMEKMIQKSRFSEIRFPKTNVNTLVKGTVKPYIKPLLP